MTNRVNEIDILRFIAAMAVMIFHYSFRGFSEGNMTVMSYGYITAFSKYGFLGVELFFMISGFVILLSAKSENLSKFLISRVIRLYPAFWICCTLTFIITVAIGAPRYHATFMQYLANMTMISGFSHVPYIDGVYWSLLVEIKFYVLIALILALKKLRHIQLYITCWFILTVILQFFSFGKIHNLLISDYATYFIAGSTFYLIYRDGISESKIILLISSWVLALFQSYKLSHLLQITYKTEFDFLVISAVLTVFYIIMLMVSLRKTGSIASHSWVTIGAITYPLYLIHQNIGYMIFNLAYPYINLHVLFWTVVITITFFSYLINRFLESKLQNFLYRLNSHIQSKFTSNNQLNKVTES
ncbi:acyltransferase family protein [Methyloradius palustris]|uniref:acyltransferase family protein n=1 Tax=Methyloradius palustris TaxID=2778876 RepID=UPI001C8BA5DE|nr:acyltransferase [Methyloradius palustris]